MLITLAYPYDGHDPDDTIEVDDHTGRLMLRDGLARPAVGPDARHGVDLEAATVAELRDFAQAQDPPIDLAGATKKADIAAVIGDHLTRAPHQPVPGTNTKEAADER